MAIKYRNKETGVVLAPTTYKLGVTEEYENIIELYTERNFYNE